jgi:DNA polymerase III alpha subunit
MEQVSYAELHCHTNFSFLDGASPADDLVERAVELGLSGLAVTDHNGLYGAVRFVSAAQAADLHPVVGLEIELLDAAAPDPHGLVVPPRRPRRRGSRRPAGGVEASQVQEGIPLRPRPARTLLPGHREPVKEDLRGIRERTRGPHLLLLARSTAGWRSLSRLISRANLAGTKGVPRFSQALLADHTEGLAALSGCADGELARRLRAGDRAGARAVAERYANLFGGGEGVSTAGFFIELSHHLLPDDDWLVTESAALARELGLPVVVTNDVHYARAEDRELADVLTAIRHGRTLDTLGDLRRPDGESYLKSGAELARLPPGDRAFEAAEPRAARAWAEGIATAAELAASCSIDLGFEQYRFPGFPVPDGETSFSYLSELCWEGARKRYHPLTSAVVKRLAHELEVIERAGLAEFFLICWDLMRFAKERKIPAQGRGSATSSIVSYTLGISRVEPIVHNLLFERFINPGRTTYPDVDIDFSSERREEVIQYIYGRYGPEHTGMVCNLVTYRARSAVREVGYALGFPRPLVDRVAKALETYDSVMVRRDLEADGGFAEFFKRTGEDLPPEAQAAEAAQALGLVDGMGQLNTRIPLVGKVPPWRQPPKPEDPDAPHPFAWLREESGHDGEGRPDGGDGGPTTEAAAAGRPATEAAEDVEPTTQAAAAPRVSEPESAVLSSVEAAPRPSTSPRTTQVGTGGKRVEAADLHRVSGTWGKRDEAAGLHRDSGMWEGAPESPPSIRPGGRHDDEGGPGDTPASVAWLRAGRGTGYAAERDRLLPPAMVAGRQIDPESGMPEPPPRLTEGRLTEGRLSEGRLSEGRLSEGRQTDRLGRPNRWDPPPERRADQGAHAAHSKVARVEPEPPPQPRGGSTVGLSHWERWLEFCARIDGFPRHLSIHSGGMLVTGAPLIDIAPLERATMPDRVVVQFDKRDVEELKLIKLDLLGLGMLAAMDETLQLIEHDCAVCLDLDRIPEEIPEVFAMLQAADTVGVFQVESRAQMQTLPKSLPRSLDDLVVEVAIIRPGPIQGNAVHPFLRRKQGLEPVTYLHPSLEPVLNDSMGVILYQEQVMRIAIEVAGFTPADSDGFRRAMGTWRSTREMEKLHRQFVEGCLRQPGMTDEMAEELFRQVAAFASFGFAKSHAAAFARTAYESAFLKLFYPAQFLVGLINAQPMGFYPVEVLVNDAKRHGVTILPVDINASSYKTTTEWAGRPGWVLAGAAGDDGAHDDDPGDPLPDGAGIAARPRPVRSPACIIPGAAARERWIPDTATGWGVRLGLGLVKGIGDQHEELLNRELARGPYRSLADVVERTGLPEEVLERLIRTGAMDSLGQPRRELLWQLREVAGASRGRVDGRTLRAAARAGGRRSAAAGRPMDLRLPATDAPPLPELTESERLGDAYAVIGLDARRQVVELFRPALDRLGAVPNATLAEHRPGRIRIGGLVVTRQHPMTAKGTVFLALEDETGMVNVTLWPDTWARLRGVVRRHALLLVDGELQREVDVVNVVAHQIRALPEVAGTAGGPEQPTGVRQLGHAGMRRLG